MSVLVGHYAPDFREEGVVNGEFAEIALSDYLDKKNVILLFYPLDFTFVCPTELVAFQEKLHEFEKKDTVVLGCSIDSKFSHYAWVHTPKNKGGIQGITYPLISDIHRTIVRDYGIMSDKGVAYRGLFLIDKKGIVRHQVVNDLPLGRSVDEALRMVSALEHFEKHGEVCPADWAPGKEAMHATAESVSAYLAKKHK